MCKRGFAVFVFMMLVSLSWAQQSVGQYVSSTSGLSVRELEASAISRNKELQVSRESLRQAEARLTQAKLLPNPSLEVSRITDVLFGRDGDTGLLVMLSQELELGGKRGKRMSVEETSVEVAKADIANAERQLSIRLRVYFWEATGIAAKLELFDRLDELNQQLSSVMEIRVRAGDASKLDSQLLAGETGQVRARRIAAENQLDGVLLQIRSLAGLTVDESLVLRKPPSIEFGETESSALAHALENRPDLKAARLREGLEDAGITLAKSQSVPNVTAFVRYGRESLPVFATAGGPRSFERENVMEFGASIPLPLFNRQQGNIAEAFSRRTQARAEREALEAQIKQEVLLAFRRYEAARRSMDLLQSGVLEPNREGLRIIQLAYGLGEMRLVDAVNQQRVVLSAETDYVDAQTELNSALAALESAMAAPARY